VPPACTGTGFAVFVSDKSAEGETYTTVEALLLPEFGSPVTDEAIEAVCVMVEPEAVFAFTPTV
jgi:hypothetical protein